MSMSIGPFLKRVATNRLGQVLLFSSLFFVLVAMVPQSPKSPMFFDCAFNREGVFVASEIFLVKPIWVVIIGVTYLPSILLTIVLTKIFEGVFSLTCTPTARVEIIVLVVCSSIQWILIGYAIERCIKKRRSSVDNGTRV